jgi:hypothetical protein
MTNILEKLIELYEISYEGDNNLITRGLIHEIIIDIVSEDSIKADQGRLIFDRLSKIRRRSNRKIKATI